MKKFLLSILALGAMTLTAGAQDTGTEANKGSKDAPLTVTEFLEQGVPSAAVADTYVQGYIVGFVDGQNISTGAHFSLDDGVETSNTNLLLAASSSEDNTEYCIVVQLPSGTYRNALSLAQHPENLYHEVILGGSHEKYFGVNGLKSVNYYQWVGDAPDPGTVTPPSVEETGTKDAPLTVTKFIELGTPLADVPNTWVTGFIVGSMKTGGKSMADAELGVSAESSTTNIIIAATANPTSVNECIPIQLPIGDIRNALNLNENPDNLGKTVVLCGSRSTYCGVAGLRTPTEFTLDGVTPDPVVPEGQFYKGLETNADDWTLNVGEVPEGLNYVWTWDSKYGIKASAFYNNTRFETDIWAVSPVIDLTAAKEATLKFSQAANYLNGHTEYIVTNVKVEGGEWEALEVAPMPAGNNWTFVNSSASLNNYVGKKIQIGFNYKSSNTDAATWEIKNLIIEGETDNSGVEAIEATDEAVRFFTIDGVEVANPANGIYIKVVAGKASKVLVK